LSGLTIYVGLILTSSAVFLSLLSPIYPHERKVNDVVVLSTESKSGSPGFAATSIVYPPGDYKVELLIFTTEDKYVGGFFEVLNEGQSVFNSLPGMTRTLRNNFPINSRVFQTTDAIFTIIPFDF
jgi:hypothetical protein